MMIRSVSEEGTVSIGTVEEEMRERLEEVVVNIDKQSAFREHLDSQFHADNFYTYKRFNMEKTSHHDPMLAELSQAMKEADNLQNIAVIDTFLHQCRTELRDNSQKLYTLTSQYNWREAHTHILYSSDRMTNMLMQLKQKCAQYQNALSVVVPDTTKEQPLEKAKVEQGEDIEIEEIQYTEELRNVQVKKKRSREIKHQRKDQGRR